MTTPHYQDATVTLHHGDCLEVMREVADNSVDAVVTDPPYGLEFMGKEWDGADGFRRSLNPSDVGRDNAFGRTSRTSPEYRTSAAKAGMSKPGIGDRETGWPSHLGGLNPKCRSCDHWQRGANPCKCDAPDFPNERLPRLHSFQEWCEAWSRECLRVLKPGGHLLAFGGTRTFHRLACAVEDAGFELRDSIAWLYGSGFPKSLDVSKAIDKAAGAEREVIGQTSHPDGRPRNLVGRSLGVHEGGQRLNGVGLDITAPATDDARTWQGWGTALKPAFEPVVVARKPLIGTVASNVLAHGTGALNVDGCRVEGVKGWLDSKQYARGIAWGDNKESAFTQDNSQNPSKELGRWPANVILDESQAAELDAQSGERPGDNPNRAPRQNTAEAHNRTASMGGTNADWTTVGHADSGGASRFFFIAREDNDPCPNPEPANTAGPTSSQLSASADSAPSDAATSESPDTDRQTDSPSMSGTPSASRPSDASGMPTTTSTGSVSSHDWQPAKPSQMVSPARYAASLSPTDTTTTTTDPSTSDGSADPTTSSTTPTSVPGVPLDALGSRFTYVAKADASERVRVNGTAHPTVKPLSLMRWLVRLVTPPGGTVLEPFAGSGTTVEAAILEGFHCIAIERETDYLPLITQRINRRRNPVAAIKATDDDRGLFDLLEGEPA